MDAKAVKIVGLAFSSTSQPWMVIYQISAFGLEIGAAVPTVVHLEHPLPETYWGGFRTIGKKQFELAAEVGNLARSVTITGDRDTFGDDAGMKGWTSKMSGLGDFDSSGFPIWTSWRQGTWDQRYVRMEYCGQRNVLGHYCLHFHLMSSCPSCVAIGNAIVDSQQVGITIHATHKSLVDRNVIWDARGNGIYTEAGNEMNNTISNNLVVCETISKCNVDIKPASPGVGAIYLIGMSNDIIGNHLVGYDNGIYSQGSAAPHGQWPVTGKVCTVHTPFGKIKGNVEHDCGRYGLYLDYQFPRMLKLDENGLLTDPASCNALTADGKDNGVVPANVVEDEFNWHCHHVGQYDMGDVSFVRYTSVNNFHGMYWKKSKNFADGVSHHIRDSVFANDPTDPYGFLQLLGPAGPFTFKLTNTSFHGGNMGCGAVCAGQHCGLSDHNYGLHGSLCNVEYMLEGVDFSDMSSATDQRVAFGASGGNPIVPVFLSEDASIPYKALVSGHLDGFADVAECTKTAGNLYAGAYGCNVPLRRLTIFAPDMGNLTLSGKGYGGSPTWSWPTAGQDAGNIVYDYSQSGYGSVPVFPGETYTLDGLWRSDGVVIQFSDTAHGEAAETLSLNIGGATCDVTNSPPGSFQTYTASVPALSSNAGPGPCATAVQLATAAFGVGSPLSTSATASAGDAGLAVDGKQVTDWTCEAFPCQLQVALTSRSSVTKIFVKWGGTGPKPQFQLALEDLSTFAVAPVALPSVRSFPVSGQDRLEEIVLNGAVIQNVKFTFSTVSDYVAVSEVYVFGEPFSPWDPSSATAHFAEVANVASLAVDGNPGTRWGSNGGGTGGWWSCNFNGTYKIDRLAVSWEVAYAKSYDVQVFSSGSGWSTVHSEGGTLGQGSHVDHIELNGVVADGIKISSTEDATIYGISIWEVYVQGSKFVGEPIPLSAASASAGFEDASYVAGHVVDGNLGTRWSSNHGSAGAHWWQVEFPGTYEVIEVKLKWEGAFASKYGLQLRDGACAWFTASTVDKDSYSDSWDMIALPPPRTGNALKVDAVTLATVWGASLWEVEVIGLSVSSDVPSCTVPTPAPTAPSAEVLLKANSACAFFEEGPFVAGNAVDGLDYTRFGSYGFQAGVTKWWSVEFEGAWLVTGVDIMWEGAFCRDYTLQVLDAPSASGQSCQDKPALSWTTIKTVLGSDGGSDKVTLNGLGVGLQVICDTAATMWGMSFWELKVSGSLPSPEVVALAPASADAAFVEGPFAAGNAVDGNEGTRWASNGLPPSQPAWWSVDFPSYYHVTSVSILWEGAYASEYQLQLKSCSSWGVGKVGYSDGAGWKETAVGAAGDGLTVAAVTEATVWRVSFFEVQVIGYVVPAPACS
jgi:hypothetical protein